MTHDQKTQEVLGKIIKARVADLDIHFPELPMDCRISINLEMDWDGSLEELEGIPNPGDNPDRNKDRLSYTQGPYQIDLTQVIQSGPGVCLVVAVNRLLLTLSYRVAQKRSMSLKSRLTQNC